uniref:Uncharacterized protein n=1 Tax=Rhizophora mucronata TaxID=61149 RepID=A0A2P2R1V5_RHIMU
MNTSHISNSIQVNGTVQD